MSTVVSRAARERMEATSDAVDETFEFKVGRNITPLASGCWQWKDGEFDYPIIRAYGEVVPVHRWMYFAMHPDISEWDYKDHHVHHECQNPRCVNPDHIMLLTPSEHKERHRELENNCP